MSPDGLSYLDMASNALSGGPMKLVNGYWSPAYPALIGTALFLFRPSPVHEFPVVQLVNFAIFVLVLSSFTFFLKSWLAVRKPEKPYLIPFSFAVFLWFMLTFITVREVTPDLCVAAVVFCAAGICCRMTMPPSNWKWSIALGIVLGIGYYTKAVMLPLGLILLATLFVVPPSTGLKRLTLVLAGAVLLLMAAPLVALIGNRVGHLSTGETGRLNYAWYVNGLQSHVGWTGDQNHGLPQHAPRILLDNPRILEFANPVGGTYPLWFDPSYWYAGATTRFNLKEQLLALKPNLQVYWQSAARMGSLFAGAVALCIVVLRKRTFPTPDRYSRWLLVWSVAACAMYALVHVEPRFVGAFLVLFWLALYSVLGQKIASARSRPILTVVLCALFVPTIASLLTAGAKTLGVIRSDPPGYLVAANALRSAGLNPGDRIATAGNTFESYYARCAGLRMVAEIYDIGAFDRLNEADSQKVKGRLAAIGIKAIVVLDGPDSLTSPGWRDVPLPDPRRFRFLLLTAPLQTTKLDAHRL
jgi:4-amino-4-deoxy-L-arabinose transferase-like glycosyltransferase